MGVWLRQRSQRVGAGGLEPVLQCECLRPQLLMPHHLKLLAFIDGSLPAGKHTVDAQEM